MAVAQRMRFGIGAIIAAGAIAACARLQRCVVATNSVEQQLGEGGADQQSRRTGLGCDCRVLRVGQRALVNLSPTLAPMARTVARLLRGGIDPATIIER